MIPEILEDSVMTLDIGTRNLKVAVALVKLYGQFHDGSYAMSSDAHMGSMCYETDFFYEIARLDGLMPILVMEKYYKDITEMAKEVVDIANMPTNAQEFIDLVHAFNTSYAPEHDLIGGKIHEFSFSY